jgi:hypothetical protein
MIKRKRRIFLVILMLIAVFVTALYITGDLYKEVTGASFQSKAG